MNSEIFSSRYYSLKKIFMQHIGAWPEQSKIAKRTLPTLHFLLSFSLIIPQLVRMSQVSDNLDELMMIVPNVLFMCCSWIMLLRIVTSQKLICNLLSRMRQDWKYVSQNVSLSAILEKNAEEGRKKAIFHTLLIFGAAIGYGLPCYTPLVLNIVVPLNESRPKKFLLNADYGVDAEKYYWHILFHAYIGIYVALVVFITLDVFYAVWVQHCCGLFEIAGYYLEHALERFDSSDNRFLKTHNEIAYQNLCACIRQHERAMGFAKLIDTLCSPILGCTTMATMVNVSSTCFLFVVKMDTLDNFDDAFQYLSYACGLLYHLYYMTTFGEKVIECSGRISDSAYASDWCLFSLRAQKLLKLIIARAQTPCFLTATKVYILNMENYSAVLKTSVSYFTMFSSLR